jgi:histidinol-phosphatase (PHP family)
MKPPAPVSVHGGHSGQFCNHAENTLEEVVQAYIEKGYLWVGITEHMPPVSDRFLYPDEIEAGLSAEILSHRFNRYMETCRRLQTSHADQIQIYVPSKRSATAAAWTMRKR